MAKRLPFLEQSIRDHNVERTQLPGRGNGLVAARNISSPRIQVLFVRRPLMLALEDSRLPDTCYQCLRSASDQVDSIDSIVVAFDLKACTGCNSVKFCDRTCQKLAWNRYHKHECKVFSKLHPRVLPSSTRAIVRLLLERKHHLLSEEEWQQIFTLEIHQADFLKANGERWHDMCLMAKAVHTYSGTDEALDTVLKLCCILTINSFTLTNAVYEPLGVVFHPLPALINHSCTPNAYIRFDIPPPPPSAGATLIHSTRQPASTISVHALESITKGSEITIEYIDTTLPTPSRRSELSSQYFFCCCCQLCARGSRAHTDAFLPLSSLPPTESIKDAEAVAMPALAACFDPSRKSLPLEARINQIYYALSCLAKTRAWPLHRYPGPQLRRQLIILLIEAGRYLECLVQAALKARTIDEVLYTSAHHPTRITDLWMVYQLSRSFLISQFDADPTLEQKWATLPPNSGMKMTAALMCLTLEVIVDTVLPPEYKGLTGPMTAKGKAAWGKAYEQMRGQSNAASTEAPPPYVGPEVAPEGLPDYKETLDKGGNDYPGSKMGQFEMLVAKAMGEVLAGDSKRFWADYELGRFAPNKVVQEWWDSRLEKTIESERQYTVSPSR